MSAAGSAPVIVVAGDVAVDWCFFNPAADRLATIDFGWVFGSDVGVHLGGLPGGTVRLAEVLRSTSARRTVPPGSPPRWTPTSDPKTQPKSMVASLSAAGLKKHQSTATSPATTMTGADPAADIATSQSFFGLMLASLGRARPDSTSIALRIPEGTGQAGCTRCSAARRRVTGPSPR